MVTLLYPWGSPEVRNWRAALVLLRSALITLTEVTNQFVSSQFFPLSDSFQSVGQPATRSLDLTWGLPAIWSG